jgi:hypothetical protein
VMGIVQLNQSHTLPRLTGCAFVEFRIAKA